MLELSSDSVDLIVTSPPYPMIAMWDDTFATLAPQSAAALAAERGPAAFEAMHAALDTVWAECARVLCPGGIACINIGDAVRTLGGLFQLYSNHARIIRAFVDLGLHALPAVIWRKQTNAPNKFMGSGMLPPGAYVTLEHEFVLVFRKGNKREFKGEDLARRRASAFFWEERNAWFSDVWFDIKGASQQLADKAARTRSGAFPFELAWRLIHMFSIQGDTVLDPFLGTGTTLAAAAAAGRNSAGYEVDPSLATAVQASALSVMRIGNETIRARVQAHAAFAEQRTAQGKEMKHVVAAYGLPCVSRQESGIALHLVESITCTGPCAYTVEYNPDPAQALQIPQSQIELF
jgi:DNA modification methylase